MKLRHLVRVLQKSLYVIIIGALVGYLYMLGPSPWQHVCAKKWLFLQVMGISGVAVFVQAQSFRAVKPLENLSFDTVSLVGIWSLSAAMSVIAPVVAGIATRTTLLVRAGMPLSVCVTTTFRQLWMGLEYALLIGGVAAFAWPDKRSIYVVGSMLLLGVLMTIIRMVRVRVVWKDAGSKWYKFLGFLQEPIPMEAHFWFVAQLGAMSATYLIVFKGFAASLGFAEALLLSSMTVLTSLLIIIPNGIGVLDALWVLVATRSGLDLGYSTAIAIIMRLANLCTTLIFAAILSLLRKKLPG